MEGGIVGAVLIASVDGMALMGVSREVVRVEGDAMRSDQDTSWSSSTERRTVLTLNAVGVDRSTRLDHWVLM